jgi:2,3-bisphosphoglycerate-dependent phosphoglycerate mutase
MQLYFIRHAQSTNNALYVSTGSSYGRDEDPELTELGIKQANELAEFLKKGNPNGGARQEQEASKGFGLTHLYSSLMRRAVQTGWILAKQLDISLIAWKDLHEEGGIFRDDDATGESIGLPGRPRRYFETRYSGILLPDELDENGWWNHPRESTEEAMERAQRVLKILIERHGESRDRVAFVSHGGFYNLFVFSLLGLPFSVELWFTMNNAAVSRFDLFEGKVNPVYTNRMDFLPQDLIT